MERHRPPSSTRGLTATALALLALATQPLAQSALSGSENYIAVSRGLAVAGAAPASESYSATAQAGLVRDVANTASANYVLAGAQATIEADLSSGPPVVLGVAPSTGDKAGGEIVKLIGANLEDLDAVSFAGNEAWNYHIVSNTQVQVETPAGTNALGNSLGAVAVTVEGLDGQSSQQDAFTYLPALSESGPVVVGETMTLHFESSPGSFALAAVGKSIPGFGITFPGIDGALEIVLGMTMLIDPLPSPTGVLDIQAVVPMNPALIGATFDFQAAELTSFAPLSGSFTNTLSITIQG